MPGQTRNARNAEMAQMLKRTGSARTYSRCCICGQLVATHARSGRGMMADQLPDTSTHVTLHCRGRTH